MAPSLNTPANAAPTLTAFSARTRAITRPARAGRVLLALFACLALFAAAPLAVSAAPAPTVHDRLTVTEQHFVDELLKLLTIETPEDAAGIMVKMLQNYAAPTGPKVQGCLVSAQASRAFRRLPVPAAPKWQAFFEQLRACGRAPTLARTAKCVGSSMEGFGLATPGAQRDLVQLFYCEMICTDQGEGCGTEGKDCQVVTRFDQCARSTRGAKKNSGNAGAAAPAAKGGAASQAKASSYYYLDNSGR
jgi:hypothetical protein